MNLDRFSVPMAWEWQQEESSAMEVEYVKAAKCCGCGKDLDLNEEDLVQSEIYEDDFMHDDQVCINRYYANEKRTAGHGNPLK